jgi:uncharacterized protein
VLAHAESVRIARPTEVVWALVGYPTAWSRWARQLDDVEIHGETAVGTTITYTYRGRRAAVTITEFERERLVEIAASEKSYEMRESIALVADDEATEVSIEMRFEPTAMWSRLVAPLFIPIKGVLLGRDLRRSLHALRRAAEGT